MNRSQKTKKTPTSIKIFGLFLSESYQRSKYFALKLRKYHKKSFSEPIIKGFLEVDWIDYVSKLQRSVGGQTWAVKKGVVVYLNDIYLGGDEELFARFPHYHYRRPSEEEIKGLTEREYTNHLNGKGLLYSYIHLHEDGHYYGTILFELRADLLPKTCSWFAHLCDSESKLGFSYKGSRVHRICKSGWFQAGRVEERRGGFMVDESLCYKHDRRGTVSLANNGPNSNECEFFVTFKPSQWMDQRYVAFGRVVEGWDVMRRLEDTACTYESPDRPIVIQDCGVAPVGLARYMNITKLKMRGLTVGQPHIHLETFMDIVFDRFCEVLFERLDEEVKRKIHGEWMMELLWGLVQPYLAIREPVVNVLDPSDVGSGVFREPFYIQGLYGLEDIPDLYLMKLLHEVVGRAVDLSEVTAMAESIVRFLLENVEAMDSDPVAAAQSFLNHLIENVNRILFAELQSSGTILTKEQTSDRFSQKSRVKTGKEMSGLETTKLLYFSSTPVAESSPFLAQSAHSSTRSGAGARTARGSIVRFIVDMILGAVKSVPAIA